LTERSRELIPETRESIVEGMLIVYTVRLIRIKSELDC